LIYTYETMYINFHNDMVSRLNKVVINVLNSVVLSTGKLVSHFRIKLYIISSTLLKLEKNLVKFYYVS